MTTLFVVSVADNFHHMDQEAVYTHGEFATWSEALAAARGIVDRCLVDLHKDGMTADALYSRYTTFGDDAFIVPNPVGERFSGWEYAKQRCAQICG
jgi:hypothetical protein